MNSRERFLTTFQHREPDRVPVKFQLLYDWQLTEESYQEYIEYNKKFGDISLSWVPDHGHYFVDHQALSVDVEKNSNGDECVIVHTPKGPLRSFSSPKETGVKYGRPMRSVEDAFKFLSLPDVAVKPVLDGYFQKKKLLNGEGLIWIGLSDPIGIVSGHFEEESFALLVASDEELIDDMLETVTNRQLKVVKYLLENGVRGVFNFSGSEFAIPPLMSPKHFSRFVTDFNSRLYKLVHQYENCWVETHCHGKVSNFLEEFVEMGSDLLNPLEPPPLGDVILSDAKKRVGDKLCLVGNIQLDDVERAPPQYVRNLTRKAIRDAAPGGGFILTLCASLYRRKLDKQCVENLKVILDTINDNGKYPIT